MEKMNRILVMTLLGMFIIPHHPTDNRKNNILVLCERPTYCIYRCFGGIKKSFCIMVA